MIGGNFINQWLGMTLEALCNHKWNGTSPSFIVIAIVTRKHDVARVTWIMSHCPADHTLVMVTRTNALLIRLTGHEQHHLP